MKRHLGLAASLALAASATPAFAQAEPAARISKDFGCQAFVPDSEGNPVHPLYTDEESKAVATSGGTQTLICHFDIPEGQEPATATHAEGIVCGTIFGVTTDSRIIATPGGRATLICKINGSTEP